MHVKSLSCSRDLRFMIKVTHTHTRTHEGKCNRIWQTQAPVKKYTSYLSDISKQM